ncbi:GNAT family N-acetyltransferase [Paenibacillus ginsengihumi]|uniref:GNAT family N-acetyltransferase n=1 Tax=Paenibacillus ginsengihumi TaxID=431596 RepID=UPI0003658148|nr:GNAT family N-acetyltransferase [Paenibacillus ginsengihumi]
MLSSVRLVRPSADYRDEYIDFYEEWIRSGENIVPWVVKKEPYDFEAMLDFLYSQDSEEKLRDDRRVPHSTYWLVGEDRSIVGAANVRHRLNEKLLNSGGHIGYGIRPSRRRQGCATALLGMVLRQTEAARLDKVLVVCDKGNIGSEKTILKHGGCFESEYTEEDGNIVRRFWIHQGHLSGK